MAQLNVGPVSSELIHALKIVSAYHNVPMHQYVREVLIAAVSSDTVVTGLLMQDMRARLNGAQSKVEA
jgi:plasmid stability protein